MIIKHVHQYGEMFFETEVQRMVNTVLAERGCNRKLIDIKYNTTSDEEGRVSYSALLIFE